MKDRYEDWVKTLYDKNARNLYRIALYRLQDENDAYDVVQDVFLALLSKADKLHTHDNPDAWLVTALNFGILSKLKSRQREMRVTVPLDCADMASGSEEDRTSRSIDEVLPKSFPDADRKILKLYYERELSYEEISAELGIPISTCGTKLRRARQKLKKCLERNHRKEGRS